MLNILNHGVLSFTNTYISFSYIKIDMCVNETRMVKIIKLCHVNFIRSLTGPTLIEYLASNNFQLEPNILFKKKIFFLVTSMWIPWDILYISTLRAIFKLDIINFLRKKFIERRDNHRRDLPGIISFAVSYLKLWDFARYHSLRQNVRNDVPIPVRLFRFVRREEGSETSFRVHPHPQARPNVSGIRVYACEGVRDLNFRRSNVWTTEEEKEGYEEDEETSKQSTRGLHLAEFHARVRNE